MPDESRCLVIGAGEMGRAHVSALKALKIGDIHVFGISERNRAAVEALDVAFLHGDLDAAIARSHATHAIVAGPVETLADCATRLLDAGVPNLLIEKPAAIGLHEAQWLRERAARAGASVHVGYNRRFYGSVRKALALIRASGEPISSVMFEFTEWSDVVRALPNQSPRVKARWLLANSMHVIDLAFSPVGLPDLARSHFHARGELDWHRPAAFVGSGATVGGTPFAYGANWDAPGRWGVEWMTPSTRYIFRPMEKLSVMKRGGVAIVEVDLDDDLDQRFKPGLFRQDRAFLGSDDSASLVTLDHALELVDLAGRIGGYEG
jgi:predicted dehydrogenase